MNLRAPTWRGVPESQFTPSVQQTWLMCEASFWSAFYAGAESCDVITIQGHCMISPEIRETAIQNRASRVEPQ